MLRVLVLATGKKSTGGIVSVLKLYEQSLLWKKYHCRWIGTHRDGNIIRKLFYFFSALSQFLFFLPFYDIVHIHFSTTSSAIRKYPFFLLAKSFKKKIVIHLHCGTQIDDIWSYVYQTMFEQCDTAIVLSEVLKEKVEEHVGKSEKIIVVYNPCPIVLNKKMYKKQNYILFSGHLNIDKGYKDLILAFSKIASNFPDWSLVFAGNGEIEQAANYGKELGVDNQVKLLGWVCGEEKHKAYCEASVLCLPSYAEGFPMTVLDAWAYGLPVVTTPVGGIPDIAVDGVNMLLFNPGDVNTLAIKLQMIISDGNLRNRLSEESKKLAIGKFSLKDVTDHIDYTYSSLIN